MTSLVALMEKYSKFAEKSLDQLLKDDTSSTTSTASTTTRPASHTVTARSVQPTDTTTTSASLCFTSSTEIHYHCRGLITVVLIVGFSEHSLKFLKKVKKNKKEIENTSQNFENIEANQTLVIRSF